MLSWGAVRPTFLPIENLQGNCLPHACPMTVCCVRPWLPQPLQSSTCHRCKYEYSNNQATYFTCTGQASWPGRPRQLSRWPLGRTCWPWLRAGAPRTWGWSWRRCRRRSRPGRRRSGRACSRTCRQCSLSEICLLNLFLIQSWAFGVCSSTV